ncbi:uncharacterized protein LOC128963961 [Oppia nitens]|uniref:uncharacterized protein LOC128963961 n=1 Tax=Oppia nitens TaxID=1686743 RepID=UPI0023DB9993|nr:uncharacterized protein LOC128963961 [Oppia nitens]
MFFNRKWIENIYPGKRGGVQHQESQQDQLYNDRPKSLLNGSKLHNPSECNRFYQISVVIAILLLISFYFIPFPINLALFILSLIAFLSTSYWLYRRQQSRLNLSSRDWSTAIYSPNHPSNGIDDADHQLVDVPLEPITISPDDSERHFEKI